MSEEKLWSTQEVREAIINSTGFMVGVCQVLQERGLPLDSDLLHERALKHMEKIIAKRASNHVTVLQGMLSSLFPDSLSDGGYRGTIERLTSVGFCSASNSILRYSLGGASQYCTVTSCPEDSNLVCIIFDRLAALRDSRVKLDMGTVSRITSNWVRI